MPNPETFYTVYLKSGFMQDFLSNQDNLKLQKERKELAKEIQGKHLSHFTDGVSVDKFSKQDKEYIEGKQELLSKKDDQFWESFTNYTLSQMTKRPYSLEQLGNHMNHGEELHNTYDTSVPIAETNWSMKSPYSPTQQYERSRLRNELVKKVVKDHVNRMRSFEQRKRLCGQMRLDKPTDEYFFDAAYSSLQKDSAASDKIRDLESFTLILSTRVISEEERKVYGEAYYNTFLTTFNQIEEKNIDLKSFSDINDWKNPDGTWNDKKLVENYETISLLNKINVASAKINELCFNETLLKSQLEPDKKCESFCRKNGLQLSLSSALMERLNYIQNPYYDEIDVDDPQMQKSFSPVLHSKNTQPFKNLDLEKLEKNRIENEKAGKETEEIESKLDEVFKTVQEEYSRTKDYLSTKLSFFQKTAPSSTANNLNISGLFSSWTHNEYQGFKQNLRALANAMRVQGNDMNQLRMVSDFQLWRYRYNHGSKTDENKGFTNEEKYSAGIRLNNLTDDSDKFDEDPIFESYWLLANAPSKNVTFFSHDGSAQEITIPSSVIMNPNFSRDLMQRLSLNESPVMPKEPKPNAGAAEKEKYAYEKALYDVAGIYRKIPNVKEEEQKKEEEPSPSKKLQDLQKKREDEVADIIRTNAKNDYTFKDNRDENNVEEYTFPSIPEKILHDIAYARELSTAKDGTGIIKTTPEIAQQKIDNARQQVVDAVKYLNSHLSAGKQKYTVTSFITENGTQWPKEAKELQEKFQLESNLTEQESMQNYADLLNITVEDFNALYKEHNQRRAQPKSPRETFDDFMLTCGYITNSDYFTSPEFYDITHYKEGLDALDEKIRNSTNDTNLNNEEKKLRSIYELSAKDPNNKNAQAQYEENLKHAYKYELYKYHLINIAKGADIPTVKLIDNIDKAMAKKIGEEYNLTDDDIDRIHHNGTSPNEKGSYMITIPKYVKDLGNWEEHHGFEKGHIKNVVKESNGKLSVDTAKIKAMNKRDMSSIKKHAKLLGISTEDMIRRLESRQKDFPDYNAKFFYEDTKLNYETAAKTFGMSSKEYIKFCKAAKRDPIDFAEKVVEDSNQQNISIITGDYGMTNREFFKYCLDNRKNPLTFARDIAEAEAAHKKDPSQGMSISEVLEEYGMSAKEFHDYCKETKQDPFQVAERTYREMNGKYQVLDKVDNGAVKKGEEEALINESPVKDFSETMQASLRQLGISADNDGKVLGKNAKIAPNSCTETLLNSGKYLYGMVMKDLQTKVKNGEKMSAKMDPGPLYMLAAHELLKAQLTDGGNKYPGITDLMNSFTGKDKGLGTGAVIEAMKSVKEIKDSFGNMSVSQLETSLANGTFMKDLDPDVMSKVNTAFQNKADSRKAEKSLRNDHLQMSGNNLQNKVKH